MTIGSTQKGRNNIYKRVPRTTGWFRRMHPFVVRRMILRQQLKRQADAFNTFALAVREAWALPKAAEAFAAWQRTARKR